MPNTGSSDNARDAGAARGLLVHSAGPADSAGISAALRSAANAVAALPPGVPVEVVVQGPGVGLAPGELSSGVGSVPAAIAHLGTRQWEGGAYVRL
ncbi:hypothetical protein [Arthrobacter sp. SO3]|uniref:hypothetical protein n=1 Tax=Arthrobacter sp. SO3 TaxID=1897057 RepID=UPI001CFF83CF|nr:hypothetical protein [Arthrobacter sp. SO3]MCB5291801.1 hypothetical protein [Arthrobacter sp. SO3]